jgi:hypothetical protein
MLLALVLLNNKFSVLGAAVLHAAVLHGCVLGAAVLHAVTAQCAAFSVLLCFHSSKSKP